MLERRFVQSERIPSSIPTGAITREDYGAIQENARLSETLIDLLSGVIARTFYQQGVPDLRLFTEAERGVLDMVRRRAKRLQVVPPESFRSWVASDQRMTQHERILAYLDRHPGWHNASSLMRIFTSPGEYFVGINYARRMRELLKRSILQSELDPDAHNATHRWRRVLVPTYLKEII